jgi:hypothetical protein
MAVFVQSINTNIGFMNGSLGPRLQQECMRIAQPMIPGFGPSIIEEACSQVVDDTKGWARIDFLGRSVLLGQSTFALGIGSYHLYKGCTAKTWRESGHEALNALNPLLLGIASATTAILWPFDPVPYESGNWQGPLSAFLSQ